MQIDRIRVLIEEGRAIERQNGILRRAVIELAHANNRSPGELQVQKAINFVGEYIEHAAALIKLIEKTAASSGVQHDLQSVLDTIESYFLSQDDIIPDRLGLVGLLDDAYLTHRLLQSISDTYKSESGTSLLPLETHEDNAFVGRLIGEPFVGMLDHCVEATLVSPGMQQNISRLLKALGRLKLSSGPDPVWGHVRATVDARLEPLGFY